MRQQNTDSVNTHAFYTCLGCNIKFDVCRMNPEAHTGTPVSMHGIQFRLPVIREYRSLHLVFSAGHLFWSHEGGHPCICWPQLRALGSKVGRALRECWASAAVLPRGNCSLRRCRAGLGPHGGGGRGSPLRLHVRNPWQALETPQSPGSGQTAEIRVWGWDTECLFMSSPWDSDDRKR